MAEKWQAGRVGTSASGDQVAKSGASESDDERFLALGLDLAAAVEAAMAYWVATSVARHLPQPWSKELEERVVGRGQQTAEQIGRRLRELLALDVDEQWTNPLSVIRTAVETPTTILADAGVPRPQRDAQSLQFNPDDHYDLSPAAFADLGPEAHDLGISWGAAKAHLHLRRRRDEREEGAKT